MTLTKMLTQAIAKSCADLGVEVQARGTLVVIEPLRPILRGFSVDGSIVDHHRYVSWFAQPLFTSPPIDINLAFGDRLSGKSRLWSEVEIADLELSVKSIVPQLLSLGRDGEFLSWLKSRANSYPYGDEASAFTHVRLRQFERGAQILAELIRKLGSSGWEGRLRDNLEQSLRTLISDPDVLLAEMATREVAALAKLKLGSRTRK